MRKLVVVAAALLLSIPMAAQDWARQNLEKSPRHGEWVQIKHDNRTVSTFVVYPESKQKAPVVIVIHEIFGATDWSRSLADQLAAKGYIAVAPDLLSGMGPNGGKSSDFPSVDAARDANRKDLSAAFVFYGTGPKDVTSINAPVYGFYAGKDARIGATLPDTTDAMKKAGKKFEPVTYEGAGHGFMRAGEDPGDTNPDNKKAREEAWKRWTELLKSM